MIEDDELHLHNEYNPQADHQAHSEDRLPWLEAVEPDTDHEGGARRITGVLLAGLIALVLLVGGLWWMNNQTPPVKTGDGNLIAAAEGDYKTKPSDAGGMKVDGQGDTAAAAAQGADSNGKIDANAKTEAPIKPVVTPKADTAKAPTKPNSMAKIADVRDVTPKPAPATAPNAAAPAAAGTGMIQLGAYGSKTSAEQGWAQLKAKYDFLAPLSETIVQASVGGATVYRLRASAGGAASETCAKLKAAGASCIIAH